MTVSEFVSKLQVSDIISTFALILAGLSILWNVYRDILLKPKLKVNIQISQLIQPGNSRSPTFIDITATNHGPGSIICESIWMKKRSFWRWLFRKKKVAFILHDYTNPLSGKLPKKLEVGEKIMLLFPHKEKMFLAYKPTHVGIMDSFGRMHWASKKSLKEAEKSYLKDFSEEKWDKKIQKNKTSNNSIQTT